MEIRKAVKSDVNNIMKIIKQAQEYFKNQGIDQWQNNYPNIDTINSDILNGNNYVMIKDNDIVATAVIIFDGEETYNNIYEGQWLTNSNYTTIHRIAVNNNYKGLGLSKIFKNKIEEFSLNKNIHSIRVDTHKDNISMQKLLNKCDFEYCGIINLKDGSKRIAFEKII